MTSARIQRWAILLGDIIIGLSTKYNTGQEHANANAFQQYVPENVPTP